jgi:DNA-binding NarL/FixJ family response regulator
VKVLICDDHAVFADSLAMVLRESGHDVVGVVYSPEAALRLLQAAPADLCLLDLQFPTGSVLESLPGLVRAAPSTRFVVLSGSIDAELLDAALAAGVRGFAHKGQQAGEIVAMLARVHAGDVVIDPTTGCADKSAFSALKLMTSRACTFVRGVSDVRSVKFMGGSWSNR